MYNVFDTMKKRRRYNQYYNMTKEKMQLYIYTKEEEDINNNVTNNTNT